MWGSLRRSGIVGICLLGIWLAPPEASASFPGENGLIAFQNDSVGGIYTINADGSDREKIDPEGFEPAWSPDGKRIAFVKDNGGEWDVFTMKANGNDKERVTRTDDKSEWEPAWSPNGKRVIFRRGKFRGGPGTIFVINLKTGNETKFGKGENPDWSVERGTAPDGRIAYSRFVDAGECGLTTHTFTAKPNGSKSKLAKFECQTTSSPSWRPDGKRLAATSDGDIYVTDGPTPLRMTDLAGFDGGPAWAPDSTEIVFGNEGLYRVSVTTPLVEQAIPNTADVEGAEPSWQPTR